MWQSNLSTLEIHKDFVPCPAFAPLVLAAAHYFILLTRLFPFQVCCMPATWLMYPHYSEIFFLKIGISELLNSNIEHYSYTNKAYSYKNKAIHKGICNNCEDVQSAC